MSDEKVMKNQSSAKILHKLRRKLTKEEPTLSHCAWAMTSDHVVRWQIYLHIFGQSIDLTDQEQNRNKQIFLLLNKFFIKKIFLFPYFQPNFSEIFAKSIGLKPEIFSSNINKNETIEKSILSMSVEALNQNFTDCDMFTIKYKIADCYKTIADYMKNEIESKLNGLWVVSVGENLKCYMTTRPDYGLTVMVFTIGDIAFDIENVRKER